MSDPLHDHLLDLRDDMRQRYKMAAAGLVALDQRVTSLETKQSGDPVETVELVADRRRHDWMDWMFLTMSILLVVLVGIAVGSYVNWW